MMSDNCVHCKFSRRRIQSDGVFYHTFKESNGYDYDTYTAVCGNQTKEGLKAYRSQALTELKKKVTAAAQRLRVVESVHRQIKKATTVGQIQSALYHTEHL
jgi:hypothetical protein